ncbi:MAG: class I SAM-dependent methyltransferase [Acidobacteriia bacterium]|nr:class I SAM-dependent methyltransferase [Terriglobia bacterium]
MPAGTVALRLIRGAFHQIDVALARCLAPPPKQAQQTDPEDLARFREFFRQLPADAAARAYLDVHLPRLVRTMTLVPKPAGARRALELGAYMQMTPALHALCGYPEVRGADFGPLGRSVRKTVALAGGEFTCEIAFFDAERDRFPYPDGHFSLVLCCEMLEHLMRDPMHMMFEIRRILDPGGALLLTTPNCAGLTCIANLLDGRHNPQVYSRYNRTTPGDPPHVREYTAHEIAELMAAAGFRTEQLLTERIESRDEAAWVHELLERNHLDTSLRGEQTYCIATMRPDLPVDRYPAWLYD